MLPKTLQQVFLLILFVAGTWKLISSEIDRQPYIVYMGDAPPHETLALEDHHNVLLDAIGDAAIARREKIHSYKRSFNGFAARLLPHEMEKISRDKRVVSVFRNTINKLHTTRSWDFLGMTREVQRRKNTESNIVIGLLDTGICTSIPSFDDQGYGPPPAKWRGRCVKGVNFTGCNNKVIGARYYNLEGDTTVVQSPADFEGHGTHTSSTVAGSIVSDASLYGIAAGEARGGVPSARIAMYKVCWGTGCSDMDTLAGLDDAIADGVDLISISLGASSRNFFHDPVAIGAFHALKKGILTSASTGNNGPMLETAENVAPWILTVTASSIDRHFDTLVKLGNGLKAKGSSINTFSPTKKMYPLTNGAEASRENGEMYGSAGACDYDVLSLEKVKGKIVHCIGIRNQDYTIAELKGAGIIVTTEESIDAASTSMVPATRLPEKYEAIIDHYINTTTYPVAVLYKTTTTNMTAPFVASFASRGPQFITPNILKPDISAPGLNILAAYSELVSISGEPDDNRHRPFNIMSGTSMACPHVTAAAAYVKSFHPTWSPAAIKSALMTTATPMKINGQERELAYGSGQINPTEAVDPGLIYDLSVESYIDFLCKEGYNETTLRHLAGKRSNYNCSDLKHARGSDGLNYPSMHKQIKPNSPIVAVFYRRVTHVGQGPAEYNATVSSPSELSIQVVPNVLKFRRANQRRSFKVVVNGAPMKTGTLVLSAMLAWKDLNHTVKSPIVIYKRTVSASP